MKKTILLLILLGVGSQVLAANQPPALSTSLTYTPVHQFETDINGGGSFSVDRHFLHLDFFKPLSRTNQVSLGLHYDYEHWNFNNIDDLSGAAPWSDVQSPTLTFAWIHALSQNWQLLLAPSIGLSGTSLANTRDSLVYGTVLSASRTFSPAFRLGLGAGVFERFGKTGYFPFIMVDWKITDTLRLKNPFRAGPVGPAGLELEYNPGNDWLFAVGSAYRSYRFRLADSNTIADGISEVDFIAGFAQSTYTFSNRINLSLTGGGLFSGSLAIEDKNSNPLGNSDYDTAPFLALTVKGRF